MKKKLTFSNFLVKRLVAWCAALVAVATLSNILMFVVSYMNKTNDMEAQSLMVRGNIVEYVAGGYDTPEKISFILADAVDYRSNCNQVAYSYVDENYNVIATSEWNAFLIHQREKGVVDSNAVTDVYKCGSEEFLAVLDDCINTDTAHVFEINEAYVRDGSFIPGTVTVFENDFETVVETLDFTPENKEEYTYIHNDDFYWREAGTRNKEILADAVASAENGNAKKEYTLSGVGFINDTENYYKLYHLYNYDHWAELGNYYFATTANMVLFAAAVSFITAYLAYNKYEKQYELNEYRRNMTNALAHDLKTPLTAILGYAENLKNNIRTEKKDYYADAVLENVQRMNDIITNTLELAKVENAEPSPEETDLKALTEEAFALYGRSAEEKNITFDMNCSGKIKADKHLMAQALGNLFANAAAYAPENSVVRVTGNEKLFTMVNDCDKSLAKTSDELCTPFVKGDESRHTDGSGLGLSIVKNIAAMHKFSFTATAKDGKFTAEMKFAKK